MGHTNLRTEYQQSEHQIKRASITDQQTLEVVFTNGVVKRLDIKEAVLDIPQLAPLVNDYVLFLKLSISSGSYAVKWSNKLDLGSEYIWDKGKTIETVFDNLISMADATKAWGLSESTLRKALQRGKLREGIDAKKFAGQWILSKGAIENEYGLSLLDQIKMNEKELASYDDPNSFVMQCYKDHPKEKNRIKHEKEKLKQEIKRLQEKLERK